MRKILILGENNSIWTKRCIEHSDIIGNNEIFFLGFDNEKYDSWLMEQGIKLTVVNRNRYFKNIPKVRGVLKIRDYFRAVKGLLKQVDKFDVVHMSFVTREKMYLVKYLRKKSKKIVITFWGSDLLRVNNKTMLKYKDAFTLADIIMLSTSEMKEHFTKVFGHCFDEKILDLKFGLDSLENIDYENTIVARHFFSVPDGKTVITVGYNGKPTQNHIRVTEALSKLKKEQKNKLFLLVPVTYGLSQGYKQQLVDSFDKLGIPYQLIEDFLEDEQLCKLRECTDAFIHAQVTDAFSASIQEYLYARKIVFNPVWIPYSDMKNKGIFYYEYNDYDELSTLISNWLDKGLSDSEQQALSGNTEIIRELSSWKLLSTKWHSLYEVENRGIR